MALTSSGVGRLRAGRRGADRRHLPGLQPDLGRACPRGRRHGVARPRQLHLRAAPPAAGPSYGRGGPAVGGDTVRAPGERLARGKRDPPRRRPLRPQPGLGPARCACRSSCSRPRWCSLGPAAWAVAPQRLPPSCCSPPCHPCWLTPGSPPPTSRSPRLSCSRLLRRRPVAGAAHGATQRSRRSSPSARRCSPSSPPCCSCRRRPRGHRRLPLAGPERDGEAARDTHEDRHAPADLRSRSAHRLGGLSLLQSDRWSPAAAVQPAANPAALDAPLSAWHGRPCSPRPRCSRAWANSRRRTARATSPICSARSGARAGGTSSPWRSA